MSRTWAVVLVLAAAAAAGLAWGFLRQRRERPEDGG
jgi:hypothetical protein